MENSPQRLAIIDKMMDILERDAPAAWLFHPLSYSLQNSWYHNVKPHQMTSGVMRYRRLDPAARVAYQKKWNKPVYWPVWLVLSALILGTIPAGIIIHQRERKGF